MKLKRDIHTHENTLSKKYEDLSKVDGIKKISDYYEFGKSINELSKDLSDVSTSMKGIQGPMIDTALKEISIETLLLRISTIKNEHENNLKNTDLTSSSHIRSAVLLAGLGQTEALKNLESDAIHLLDRSIKQLSTTIAWDKLDERELANIDSQRDALIEQIEHQYGTSDERNKKIEEARQYYKDLKNQKVKDLLIGKLQKKLIDKLPLEEINKNIDINEIVDQEKLKSIISMSSQLKQAAKNINAPQDPLKKSLKKVSRELDSNLLIIKEFCTVFDQTIKSYEKELVNVNENFSKVTEKMKKIKEEGIEPISEKIDSNFSSIKRTCKALEKSTELSSIFGEQIISMRESMNKGKTPISELKYINDNLPKIIFRQIEKKSLDFFVKNDPVLEKVINNHYKNIKKGTEKTKRVEALFNAILEKCDTTSRRPNAPAILPKITSNLDRYANNYSPQVLALLKEVQNNYNLYSNVEKKFQGNIQIVKQQAQALPLILNKNIQECKEIAQEQSNREKLEDQLLNLQKEQSTLVGKQNLLSQQSQAIAKNKEPVANLLKLFETR
ncbi:MAG: hypothetical protein JSR80_07975 [Verrucomicrobia bacterium]|nr:hypothetical protein [Verrucomicrobiota bacterium]